MKKINKIATTVSKQINGSTIERKYLEDTSRLSAGFSHSGQNQRIVRMIPKPSASVCFVCSPRTLSNVDRIVSFCPVFRPEGSEGRKARVLGRWSYIAGVQVVLFFKAIRK